MATGVTGMQNPLKSQEGGRDNHSQILHGAMSRSANKTEKLHFHPAFTVISSFYFFLSSFLQNDWINDFTANEISSTPMMMVQELEINFDTGLTQMEFLCGRASHIVSQLVCFTQRTDYFWPHICIIKHFT